MGKKLAVIVVLIVLFIFMTINVMDLTGWGSAVLFPVTKVVREAFAPAQNGIMAVIKGAGDFMAYFKDNKAIRQENEELKKRIAILEENIYRLKEQELENQRLKNLLNYEEDKSKNYELLLAKIIGRDPNNWYKTIIVNRGSRHGIATNMPAWLEW